MENSATFSSVSRPGQVAAVWELHRSSNGGTGGHAVRGLIGVVRDVLPCSTLELAVYFIVLPTETLGYANPPPLILLQ